MKKIILIGRSECGKTTLTQALNCLLYTSDAADEEDSVDLGGSRSIKKKTQQRRGLGRIQLETITSK